jgi:hypothetical protein
MSEESQAPVAAPETAAPQEPVQTPEQASPLDSLDALTREQRKVWKQQKEIRDERARIAKEREEIQKLRANPKELFNSPDTKSVEDIISRLFDEEKDAPKNNHKSEDEIYAEVEKRVMEKLEAKQKEKEESTMVESEMREFQNSIKSFVDNSGKYPLIAGFGDHKTVAQVIEIQFQKDAETYGEERAAQMMISPEQAAERVEKYLATEIDRVLESEQVRAYVLKKMNAGDGQRVAPKEQDPQLNYDESSYGQNSLNNFDYSAPSSPRVSEENLTDEEAFNRALSLI